MTPSQLRQVLAGAPGAAPPVGTRGSCDGEELLCQCPSMVGLPRQGRVTPLAAPSLPPRAVREQWERSVPSLVPLADRECPKCGTTREAPQSSWGSLPGAEEPRAELSTSIQQLQQEPKASQPQVLASIQALQLALDTCKRNYSEQLAHLQQRERVVEEEQHQRLFLMQQLQALVGKKQKDEEAQTEVTYTAPQSRSCSRCSSLEERDRPEMLEQIRAGLGTQEQQSQGQGHNLAWLQKELRASWAREQRSLQQLCRAREAIQELQQEVASNGKHLAELLRQAQDTATLQAELAQARQEKAKLEEVVAAYQKEQQQLHWELRKLQGCQKQTMAAQALQERLQELSSQARHWQEEHDNIKKALSEKEEELVVCKERQHNIQKALSEKEEELVVCKVELAFLQEKLSKAREQLSSQAHHCQERHQNIQQALSEKEEELVVCKVELAFLQEKLRKTTEQLSSQAHHCQKEHHNIQQALAEKEEELVVCKVELAFLQEKLNEATEQLRDRKRQHHGAPGWALSSKE
ncbi:polyamine-modulated factor 1-binding protein 1-like [Heliangelus exortis]|uniref:polyamine-modulated factor 1-binding protein 1-like n=1 Tax=Heliangelus exortis TaxID=472823 RepID=UPI003A904030